MIQTPEGDRAFFDGLIRPSGELHQRFGVSTNRHVAEAKEGKKTPDFFKQKNGLTPLESRANDFAQKAVRDAGIAKRCGFQFSFIVEDSRFEKLLKQKLPTNIPVFHID